MRIRDRDSLAADTLCTLSWCQCRRPRASPKCHQTVEAERRTAQVSVAVTHRLHCHRASTTAQQKLDERASWMRADLKEKQTTEKQADEGRLNRKKHGNVRVTGPEWAV